MSAGERTAKCARCGGTPGEHPAPHCEAWLSTQALLERLLDDVAEAAGLPKEERGDPEALVECVSSLRSQLQAARADVGFPAGLLADRDRCRAEADAARAGRDAANAEAEKLRAEFATKWCALRDEATTLRREHDRWRDEAAENLSALRAANAEVERLRETIALLVWAAPKHRLTITPADAITFPTKWEIEERTESRSRVYEVRAALPPHGREEPKP